jgi:hypothetical protein
MDLGTVPSFSWVSKGDRKKKLRWAKTRMKLVYCQMRTGSASHVAVAFIDTVVTISVSFERKTVWLSGCV